MWPYSVKINQEIDLNGVFAYVDTPEGDAKILRTDPSGGDSQLGNLVARSMQLTAGRRGRVRDHQLARHPRRLRARAADDRADVQRVPVRELDHRDVPVGRRGPGDARLRRPPLARARLPHAGAGLRASRSTWCAAATAGPPPRACRSRACAKNIAIGDDCRGGDPDGPIDFDAVRAAARRPALYRVAVNDYIAARRLGLRGAQAQHLEAGHRHLAARRAARVPQRAAQPVRRSGR